MKKNLLLCLLLGVGSSQAADFQAYSDNAFANGPRLYAGGGIASATQGDTCNTPFFDGSCDDKDFAWKAFGGVQLNPMLGAELGYHDIGSAHLDGLVGSERVKMSSDLTGTSVAGVAYLPLAELGNINLIGKAGLMFWESQTSQTTGGVTQHGVEDGISPLMGGGAQYRMNDNLYLRGEWEHLFGVGADTDYETDVDLYSLGLIYSTL